MRYRLIVTRVIDLEIDKLSVAAAIEQLKKDTLDEISRGRELIKQTDLCVTTRYGNETTTVKLIP